MKFLYFDAVGGAAGDMIIGAFLDGLVPFEYLREQLAGLRLPDYRLTLEETQRHHISAKKFDVISPDHTHRHLSDIERLIEDSPLPQPVKEQSLAAFRRLGEAEARIHNIPLEKVHFHEVGAVDAIIDIVGAFLCVDYLQPRRVYSSPLPVSRGLVTAAHGRLPVPAPATLSLLRDFPLSYLPVEGELVTPTGAAIITTLSAGPLPKSISFRVAKTGYGAGGKDFAEVPNFLRVWLGEMEDSGTHDTVYQVETNIDDMNPEIYPYLRERLFEAGAMDVTFYAGIMKKGRPGTLISILCDAGRLDGVRDTLYRETTTIGLRYFPVHREKLQRQLRTVDSPWGPIQIKEIIRDGRRERVPEYEECRRIARQSGQPLRDIYEQVRGFLSGPRAGKAVKPES